MCVDAVGSDSNASAQLERGIRVKDRRSVANRDRLRSVAKNQVVWSSGDVHVPCALVVFSPDIIRPNASIDKIKAVIGGIFKLEVAHL